MRKFGLITRVSKMFTDGGGCGKNLQMPVKSRLIFALAACLLLSNCGLIGTALRLAPYALLLAEGDSRGKTVERRGQEVQQKGGRKILPATADNAESRLAFHR
ncbi:MAG: hypothetical protein J0L73_25290 [Verrucomicrobia bacterium]|nr:hypothetical protein [Verrucomicrobiota bacterium]